MAKEQADRITNTNPRLTSKAASRRIYTSCKSLSSRMCISYFPVAMVKHHEQKHPGADDVHHCRRNESVNPDWWPRMTHAGATAVCALYNLKICRAPGDK